MRGFEFRLETVLKYQERRKKLAELRRAQALQALRAAEDESERLERELRQATLALEACLGRADAGARWDGFHRQSRWLADQLTAAQTRVRHALVELSQANEAYRQVAALVEALLTLRQRRWQAHRAALAAREQQRLDEMVLQRWAGAVDEPMTKETP